MITTKQLNPADLNKVSDLTGLPIIVDEFHFGTPGRGHAPGLAQVRNQELVVPSAQIQALIPMMQFSVAPWRILDKEHLDAISKSVTLRMSSPR